MAIFPRDIKGALWAEGPDGHIKGACLIPGFEGWIVLSSVEIEINGKIIANAPTKNAKLVDVVGTVHQDDPAITQMENIVEKAQDYKTAKIVQFVLKNDEIIKNLSIEAEGQDTSWIFAIEPRTNSKGPLSVIASYDFATFTKFNDKGEAEKTLTAVGKTNRVPTA